jgi:hypothetical protein
MVKRKDYFVCMADVFVVVAIVLFSVIGIVTAVNTVVLLLREEPTGYAMI